MKTKFATRFSLRVKFKTAEVIEIVVIDHDTGTEFYHLVDFVDGIITRKFDDATESQNAVETEESATEGGLDND